MIDWIFEKLKISTCFYISWHITTSTGSWSYLYSIQEVHGCLPDIFNAQKDVADYKNVSRRDVVCVNVQKIDKKTFLKYQKHINEK